MAFYALNPFNELERIERQFNQMFSDFSNEKESRNWAVAIELEERKEAFLLRALLPGIKAEDLDIEVTRESVTIGGEYRKAKANEENQRFYSEFPVGKFRRTLTLPLPVVNNEAKAEYQDGILHLTLPKAPEAIHRVVKVNVLGDNEPKQIEPETPNS